MAKAGFESTAVSTSSLGTANSGRNNNYND